MKIEQGRFFGELLEKGFKQAKENRILLFLSLPKKIRETEGVKWGKGLTLGLF